MIEDFSFNIKLAKDCKAQSSNFVHMILNGDKPSMMKINGLYQYTCVSNIDRVKILINQPYFNN